MTTEIIICPANPSGIDSVAPKLVALRTDMREVAAGDRCGQDAGHRDVRPRPRWRRRQALGPRAGCYKRASGADAAARGACTDAAAVQHSHAVRSEEHEHNTGCAIDVMRGFTLPQANMVMLRCRAVREMLSSVEAFRGNSSNAQQSEARPSVPAASAVPIHDFPSDFGMSAAAPRPAVSQTGPSGPSAGPSHDPFNMLGMPAPAPKPMQSDTGFADFVGASTASRPTHTGHDSLI